MLSRHVLQHRHDPGTLTRCSIYGRLHYDVMITHWYLIITVALCTLTVLLLLYCYARAQWHHWFLCNPTQRSPKESNPAPQISPSSTLTPEQRLQKLLQYRMYETKLRCCKFLLTHTEMHDMSTSPLYIFTNI